MQIVQYRGQGPAEDGIVGAIGGRALDHRDQRLAEEGLLVVTTRHDTRLPAEGGLTPHRAGQAAQFGGEVLQDDLPLETGGLIVDLLLVAGAAAVPGGQLGQPRLSAPVHQHLVDQPEGVVSRGPVDGHGGFEHLGGREDLLHQQPPVLAGQPAEPPGVAHGIGETVGVVDPDAVDQILLAPAGHLGVGGVEDRRVLLAQPGQPGHGEEPPVAQERLPPVDQPVVLAVVHLLRGPAPGAGGHREAMVVEVQLGLRCVRVGGVCGGVGGGDDDELVDILR